MAVKIINPFWSSSAQKKAAEIGPEVVAWLQANSGVRVVSLGALKAALPDRAADMNREVMNLICRNTGIEIEDKAASE